MALDQNQVQPIVDAVVNELKNGTLKDQVITSFAVIGAIVFSVTKHNLKDLLVVLAKKVIGQFKKK